MVVSLLNLFFFYSQGNLYSVKKERERKGGGKREEKKKRKKIMGDRNTCKYMLIEKC